jgi:hypothetical protein
MLFRLVVQSANQLLMLVFAHRFFLPWRWRQHLHSIHQFSQDLHWDSCVKISWRNLAHGNMQFKVKVSIILWPTVSLSVCPGVRPPSGIRDQFFFSFSLKLSLGSCQVCYYVAPSLTWRRVCNLQLLLGLDRTVFYVPESLGIPDFILLSQIWDFPKPRDPGSDVNVLQE